MTHRVSLSPAFVRNNEVSRAAEGMRWIDSLPIILDACRSLFGLEVGPALPDLSFNYVTHATLRDGTEVILKLCYPDKEFRTEIDALRVYGGSGAVRLLAVDEELGAMVLERLTPGTMLVTVDDEEATVIAAGVMQAIWRPPPPAHRFPTVGDWAKGLAGLRETFGGTSGPFPAHLVDRAEGLFRELLASQSELVVLHGDLHHYNILAARREPWLAIDPKGIVGERAFEPYAFLLNPMDLLTFRDLKGRLQRRIAVFADALELDSGRIRDWTLAMSVLSEWWDFDERSTARTIPLPRTQVLADLSL